MADINDWKEVPANDWQEVRIGDIPNTTGILSRIGNYAKEAVFGIPEAVAALGSGAIASGAGLVAGNINAAIEGLKGNPNWGASAKQVQDTTRDLLTYKPITKSGQALADLGGQAVGLPFTGVQKAVSTVGKAVASPFLGEWPTEEKYPNLTYTLDSGAEAAALGLTPSVTGKAGSIIKGEVSPAQAMASAIRIKNAVANGVKKGISPGVNKMRNITQMDNYFKDAETVVKDIINNKSESGIPKTNAQFLEEIDSNKNRIFSEYNAMKDAVGETASVPLSGVANELRLFADAPGMAENPRMSSIRENALKYADNLDEKGSYTAAEAQDVIQSANSRLKAFYKNPSFETATPAAMEHIIASSLRKGLGDLIDNEVGSGYSELKNKYGAYKTLEQDVAHRATVSQRQRPFGFFDYGNILTGMEAANALMTLSPVSAAKALVIYEIKNQMKKRNQPDYNISKMFKTVDKEMGKNIFDNSKDPNLPPAGAYDPETMLSLDDNFPWDPIKQPPIKPLLLEHKKVVSTGEPLLTPGNIQGVSSPPLRGVISNQEVPKSGTVQPVYGDWGNEPGIPSRPLPVMGENTPYLPDTISARDMVLRGLTSGGKSTMPPNVVTKPNIPNRSVISEPPVPIVTNRELANFFKGTIPVTSYAPGTPRPDIKTYWVNEALKQAAAQAAREKLNK